jgi:hypothetical protein
LPDGDEISIVSGIRKNVEAIAVKEGQHALQVEETKSIVRSHI